MRFPPSEIYLVATGTKLTFALQVKVVETTLATLQDSNDVSLPPLMNPAILEASDDLTNLSHLNEPAGMIYEDTNLPYVYIVTLTLVKCCRP